LLNWKLPVFPAHFQVKHLLSDFKVKDCRSRIFTPKRLFQSLIQLIGGGNHEGYSIALMKCFSGKQSIDTPHKSSFCRARQRVSYLFFSSILDSLLKRADPLRKLFLGLHVYAIDGKMLRLPRSQEILSQGYSGRAVSDYRDTYYPRAFLTHAYDVLSGVTRDLQFGPRLHEHADALVLMQKFESNSLTLYDRLFFNRKLVRAHYTHHNYFLFRCRENACKGIQDFFRSRDSARTIQYAGFPIHLVKVQGPRSEDGVSVFATNLPKELVRAKLIRKIYRLRWEVETSFLELTGITQAEQWHSKTINGVLQELMCRFWLINYTKIQMLELQSRRKSRKSRADKSKNHSKPKHENPLQDSYKKPNFKLLYCWVVHHFNQLLRRTLGIWSHFERQAKMSTERRVHWKRRYPREIVTGHPLLHFHEIKVDTVLM